MGFRRQTPNKLKRCRWRWSWQPTSCKFRLCPYSEHRSTLRECPRIGTVLPWNCGQVRILPRKSRHCSSTSLQCVGFTLAKACFLRGNGPTNRSTSMIGSTIFNADSPYSCPGACPCHPSKKFILSRFFIQIDDCSRPDRSTVLSERWVLPALGHVLMASVSPSLRACSPEVKSDEFEHSHMKIVWSIWTLTWFETSSSPTSRGP